TAKAAKNQRPVCLKESCKRPDSQLGCALFIKGLSEAEPLFATCIQKSCLSTFYQGSLISEKKWYTK
ncbi:MAG: hypothetical protein P8X68_02240, partial [Desulfobacterales bacterium]